MLLSNNHQEALKKHKGLLLVRPGNHTACRGPQNKIAAGERGGTCHESGVLPLLGSRWGPRVSTAQSLLVNLKQKNGNLK